MMIISCLIVNREKEEPSSYQGQSRKEDTESQKRSVRRPLWNQVGLKKGTAGESEVGERERKKKKQKKKKVRG
jgi:hypothetical protein